MKAAAILLSPMVDLRQLPAREQDVLRRFFTQYVRGMDARSHKRWLRLAGDLWRAGAGEGFQLYRAEERSGPFHRWHRAIVGALFERQERFTNPDKLHDYLKLACWFVEWINGYPVPRSTAFDCCSEDEIREFNAKLVDLLHDPIEQRHFWPHLRAQVRREMVEGILANPNEQGA